MEEGDPKALLPWGSLYVLRNSLHTPPEKKKSGYQEKLPAEYSS